MRGFSTHIRLGFVVLALLLAMSHSSFAAGKKTSNRLTRGEAKQATTRLAEMGYGSGRSALIAFQKYEGRKVTGQLTRDEFEAITNAAAPEAKDAGYRHVEVDLDRQILLLIDDEGAVKKVLPVSTGSNKHYREKGMSGLAYTPRGRFKIYAKIAGWRTSPLGLLYYPNYFSDGLAIHGNSSVPDTPASHGCIRVPNSAAIDLYKQLPIGTILLIYDKASFVSGKDWATTDSRE
ncbi:MAG TPA: L,D-transpeptidase [Pyrinomonadaceae bacterium]|nr:L,D-transpeptidase [Pyrinomonadaceae bacterium]